MVTVQAQTELEIRHIYQLDIANDLPLEFIPLAVDHRIHHKDSKWSNIPLLNTEYDAVCILRKTVIRKLQPVERENIEVSNVSWTRKNPKTAISTEKTPKYAA